MSASYRITGRAAPKPSSPAGGESSLCARIRALFEQIKPRRVIETGTYHGTGTTRALAEALRDVSPDAQFVSIEINPRHYAKAVANLRTAKLPVRVINGISVPRKLLPTLAQIEQQYVAEVQADGLYVDHDAPERAKLYHHETDYPEIEDDVLGTALAEFRSKPDVVLLDSGGHVGLVEFQYVTARLKGPCHVILGGTQHVRHHRSLTALKADSRF
ncbi:MAG TPA: hypothetical protein VK324_17510, partial [Tepidisphaeraceae bacterium]|nr:hypothetical protein [Tepidisphaeraceae bacterium]